MKLPRRIREVVAYTKYRHLVSLYYEALNADAILEIGIREGFSTITFLCGIRDGKQGHLWSIDWGKDPRTPKTVGMIKGSELGKYFTWINQDVHLIPKSWFEARSMDVIFPDLNATPLIDVLQNCLLLMHKGSKMFLLDTDLISEKVKFIASLDKDKYSCEVKQVQTEMTIITKTVDD